MTESDNKTLIYLINMQEIEEIFSIASLRDCVMLCTSIASHALGHYRRHYQTSINYPTGILTRYVTTMQDGRDINTELRNSLVHLHQAILQVRIEVIVDV